MNNMNSVLSGVYPVATIFERNQARPTQHPPVRMNGSPTSDALMTAAIREGIFDDSENHLKTESGIYLSTKREDDSFILRPNFGIHLPERNSGIILV